MYKHYETSEEVFVDREEHIEWMNDALAKCKNESVVLHLKGIGGIGKSSLLNHWVNTHERTIRLDCEQYSEFYQRLNMLAKGAVQQGINLQRFDVLWHIRQRFVEGVEPVREEGRQWAKEIVMAIPFIGSLASIGSAINAVGSKVTPKLKGKYGAVGKWLQDTLGKNYMEELLQILWKEPRRAEFLYLEAFLEDVNSRDKSEDSLLFLLDQFEYVDDVKAQWKFRGQKINEAELWSIFLCNLSNCVGVMASRQPATKCKGLKITETELLELDRDSCIEMLELQGVVDVELQQRIVSVSAGNPFVVDAICDIINTQTVSIEDIGDLRGDTLEEVRLKSWRMLFSRTEGLLDIINRAGLVPFFTREIIEMITPSFTTDFWNRMIRLSFVKDRGDGTYVLHELARDLVKAELGSKLGEISEEIAKLLAAGFEKNEDYTLLGLSYSVKAHAALMETCEELMYAFSDLSWDAKFEEALTFIDAIYIDSDIARAITTMHKGWFLSFMNRIPEGEETAHLALESFRALHGIPDTEKNRFVSMALMYLGVLKHRMGKYDESEEILLESLELYKKVAPNPPKYMLPSRELLEEGAILHWLGDLMVTKGEFQRARSYLLPSLEKMEDWSKKEKEWAESNRYREVSFILTTLARVSLALNQVSDVERFSRRALEISNLRLPRINGLSFLGTSLLMKGKLDESRDAFEEEVELAKEMTESSPEFGRYLGALDDLFYVLRLRGEYKRATEVVQQLMSLQGEYVKKSREVYLPYFIEIHRYQGMMWRKSGNTKKAEKVYKKGVSLLRELGQMSDPRYEARYATILNDYGVFLHQVGDLQKSEEYLSDAVGRYKRALIQFPESLIRRRQLSTSLCNLGAVLLESDRDSEAEKNLLESLQIRQKIHKEAPEVFYYHNYIASVMNNLAVLQGKSGKFKDAEKYLSKALEHRMNNRTDEISEVYDPGIVAILSNLGVLKVQSGEIKEAKESFNKAIETARSLYKRNPKTHLNALSQVLCNMYNLLVNEEQESDLAIKITRELDKLGVKEIPDHSTWFVEASEAF